MHCEDILMSGNLYFSCRCVSTNAKYLSNYIELHQKQPSFQTSSVCSPKSLQDICKLFTFKMHTLIRHKANHVGCVPIPQSMWFLTLVNVVSCVTIPQSMWRKEELKLHLPWGRELKQTRQYNNQIFNKIIFFKYKTDKKTPTKTITIVTYLNCVCVCVCERETVFTKAVSRMTWSDYSEIQWRASRTEG